METEKIAAAFSQCKTVVDLIQQGERYQAAMKMERWLHPRNRRYRKAHGHERSQVSLELDRMAH